MLELALLGLLREAPVHGYELRKQLALRLGGLRAYSYGSLYPALNRLEAAGAVKAVEALQLNSGGAQPPALTVRAAGSTSHTRRTLARK